MAATCAEVLFIRKRKLVEKRTIQYSDITFPYELIRTNRKSYSIGIKETGEILVRTPLRISENFLNKVLKDKEAWIKASIDRQKEKADAKPQSNLDEKQRNALEKRYREAAKEYIPKRTDYFQILTGGAYETIIIREQKTRWGSCSSNKTLSFNWKLMLAPPRVLDYVVVHELCHLTYMNHSPEFWNMVEKILPDYREQKKWLKENGAKLNL
jgi:predicted metal-dependent hydrolase